VSVVIVTDSSVRIDLHAGGLLKALCRLPCGIAVPMPVGALETSGLSERTWQRFDNAGIETQDLTPE